MTERERLIHLLCNVDCNGADRREGGCSFRQDSRCNVIQKLDICMVETIADHLLANGVIVPPCNAGDTVYETQPIRQRVQAYEITTVKWNGHYFWFTWVVKDGDGIYGNVDGFASHKIGKTVFLTREEAEEALEGKT